MVALLRASPLDAPTRSPLLCIPCVRALLRLATSLSRNRFWRRACRGRGRSERRQTADDVTAADGHGVQQPFTGLGFKTVMASPGRIGGGLKARAFPPPVCESTRPTHSLSLSLFAGCAHAAVTRSATAACRSTHRYHITRRGGGVCTVHHHAPVQQPQPKKMALRPQHAGKWDGASSRQLLHSDSKVANRTERDFVGEMSSRGCFATPADFPLQDCSPCRGKHARRGSVGVVRPSRTIFCRPAPNLANVTIRNFPIAVWWHPTLILILVPPSVRRRPPSRPGPTPPPPLIHASQ